MTIVMSIAVVLVLCIGSYAFMILMFRRTSSKARTKRRMLVKEQDGTLVWRTVRARVLIGWIKSDRSITSGSWGGRLDEGEFAVLQTRKGKLVVFKFTSPRTEPPSGTIQVYGSWRELEAGVPARIFEEALKEAGIKKPSEYREMPLKI